MKTALATMKTSISEVMETMFFLPVEFSENPTEREIKALKGKQNKVSFLDFSGDASGSVYLLVPRQLLVEMAGNFMGEPGESLEEGILEGTLMEILNMITGNALRKIKAKSPFGLGIPALVPSHEFPEVPGSMIIKTTGPEMAVHITLR